MKKDWARLFVVFLITVGAVFWALNYLFLSGKTAPKSRASGETIEVSYDPAAPTVASGADVTVMVRMKPSANISLRGYTLKFKFDKNILQAKYIDYKLGVPSPDFADTSGTLTKVNESGTINIQGEIQNATGLVMNGNAAVDLVRLVLTAKSATGTNLNASNANFFIVKSDGTIETNHISAVANLKINGGTAAANCTSFTDNFSDATLNQNRWTAPTGNSGNVSITAGDVLIAGVSASTDSSVKTTAALSKQTLSGNFEIETVLKTLNITSASGSGSLSGLGFFGDPYDGFAIERLDNGQLRVLYDWNDTDWVTPTIVNTSLAATSPVKVKIKRTNANLEFHYDLLDGGGYRLAKSFNAGYTGTGNVYLYVKNTPPAYPASNARFDDFRLACMAGGATPTVPAGGTTPTTAITPTGAIPVTGNTILNLKLKFQGITSKPADARNFMNVKFTLSGDGIATPIVKSGTFVSDGSGVWSGKVGFDVSSPTGKKYMLYVKGPRHVQKKICENAPNETAAGTYRCSAEAMTLKTGENTFDFSKVLQLSGDVYGPDKKQDGVVNAIDISFIKNNLGKSDASVLSVCDINLDGKCDTQDYSLIISALSIKSDEL